MDYDRRLWRIFVLDYARNLARSGQYADGAAVEVATRAFINVGPAERWFADPAFRGQLNRLCELAREGGTEPRGPRGRRLGLSK